MQLNLISGLPFLREEADPDMRGASLWFPRREMPELIFRLWCLCHSSLMGESELDFLVKNPEEIPKGYRDFQRQQVAHLKGGITIGFPGTIHTNILGDPAVHCLCSGAQGFYKSSVSLRYPWLADRPLAVRRPRWSW